MAATPSAWVKQLENDIMHNLRVGHGRDTVSMGKAARKRYHAQSESRTWPRHPQHGESRSKTISRTISEWDMATTPSAWGKQLENDITHNLRAGHGRDTISMGKAGRKQYHAHTESGTWP